MSPAILNTSTIKKGMYDMKTTKTTLITETIFSDNGKKRYLLRKEWDASKPKLTIIMLAPSEASGIELDTSTQLVLNNAVRLGYGSVDVVNLFATLNDFSLKKAVVDDSDNLKTILNSAKSADTIVYAAGVGKAKNRIFQERQKTVLNKLSLLGVKLHCLCNKDNEARLQHPLSPAVRVWHLSPFTIDEVLDKRDIMELPTKKKN